MMNDLIPFLQHLGAFAWLVFVLWFHFQSHGDWRKTVSGTNIMGVAVVLFSIHLLIVLAVRYGLYPGREYLQAFVYFASAFFAFQRVWLVATLSRKAAGKGRANRDPLSTTVSDIEPDREPSA